MEPLRGGRLANNIPSDIQNLWNLAETKRPAVEWALKYLWTDSRVNVVLSGMSSFDNIKENIAFTDTSAPNCLNEEELSFIEKVTCTYKSKIKVNCTDCKYCMPCQVVVNIPRSFYLLYRSSFFEDSETF